MRFLLLVAMAFLLIIYGLLRQLESSAPLPLPLAQTQPPAIVGGAGTAVFDAQLQEVLRAYRAQRYTQASQQIDKLAEQIKNLQNVDGEFKSQVYRLKGIIHWQLWHYVDADLAWQQAQKYTRSVPVTSELADFRNKTRRVIEKMNAERNQRQQYFASPNVGPAAVLRGRIAVLYVFIADAGKGNWGLRQRSAAMTTWASAERWLYRQAAGYDAQLTFVRRLFVVDRHPRIKRMKVGSTRQNYNNSDKVALLAAQHLGYKSVLAFISAIKKEEGADQAMLIFHLERDDRSFALRCMNRCSENGEYVFLMEDTRSKHWQSLEYTQAHESLHLFGADDLYNIRNAKFYAPRDIMNYPSSLLDTSTLESLTAYSVGLKKQQPVTPFHIKTY